MTYDSHPYNDRDRRYDAPGGFDTGFDSGADRGTGYDAGFDPAPGYPEPPPPARADEETGFTAAQPDTAEPDGYDPAGYETSGAESTATVPLPPPAAAAPARPGPDRFGIHVVIEVLLAIAAIGALFAVYRTQSEVLSTSDGRNALIATAVPMMLLTTAVAASLRVGAVNLGVGAIAVTGATLFNYQSGNGTAAALGTAAAAVIGLAVALAVVVVVLRVPGWAAGLVLAVGVLLWRSGTTPPDDPIEVDALATDAAWIWLIAAVGLSVLGGICAAMPRLRDRLGACRDAASGTGERTRATIVTTLAALTGSGLLAGAAGIWLAWTAADAGAVASAAGPDLVMLTMFALAAALIGGTSAFGRRGGVLGSVWATTALLAMLVVMQLRNWSEHDGWLLLCTAGAGLVVTRLVEWLGGPEAEPEPVPDAPDVTAPVEVPDLSAEYPDTESDANPERPFYEPPGPSYRSTQRDSGYRYR